MHHSLRRAALSGLLVAGLAAGTAYAQDTTAQPATPPAATTHARHTPSPDRQLKHLTKTLNLTADQQNQIKPILTDEDQQIQSLHSDSSMAPKDRRAKMMSIHQDADTKVEAVLNDQQKQQFEQMRSQQKTRSHHKKAADTSSGTTAQPQTPPQP